MKNTNVIAYKEGAYGHFVNWCCDYFGGRLDANDFPPLNDLGNCHTYTNVHSFFHPPQLKDYTESQEEYNFIQVSDSNLDHDDYKLNFVDRFTKNFNYLKEHYKKVIFIFPTETSKFWITNNIIYKVRTSDWTGVGNEILAEKFLKGFNYNDSQIEADMAYGDDKIRKEIKLQSNITENLLRWGHDNVDDFSKWELREFGSKFYYDSMLHNIPPSSSMIDLAKIYPEFYFIKLDDLRDNFQQTIKSILEYFKIPISNWDKIDSIYQFWLSKQFHINKDLQINKIVDACINQYHLDWRDWNLTLIDEFAIQRILSDNQIEIKCYGLDQFPTSTDELFPLLEKRQ